MSSRIFLVEDHRIFRRTVEELVERAVGLELCGSSDTGEVALAQLPEARADLVLIDLSLPGMSGVELLAELRKQHPHIPCVVLSGHHLKEYVEQARQAGARAYVVKSEVHELATVLRDVLDGGSSFCGYD
jgi:DNA-binding NarL/FixJ family response regulator